MLNIVIPMAGRGSRFSNVGYKKPKPLIEINGKPMIELVIKNLTPKINHRFIFIVQKDHIHKYNLDKLLTTLSSNSKILSIDHITEGAACTVLEAQKFIDNDFPLMIANSDQWIDFSIDDYLEKFFKERYPGFIMTMKANDPKWSYIKFDESGKIVDVIEKEVVSQEATVGIYNFDKGETFCKYANKMILSRDTSKGEFYVAPVYKYMINDELKVDIYNIENNGKGKMYGLGTPEDLNEFLVNYPKIKIS